MAITRAQQVRQMLKEGTKKPVKQAGATNYLGKQEMVTAPKFWLSEPDHVKAKLAYITDEEEQILIDKNLYGSLKGKPNIGPAGLPSLQGGDFGSEDKGSDNQSGGNDGGNGGGDDRREQVSVARTQGKRAPTPKEVRDIVSGGPERNTGLEQNRLSNIMKMDRFTKFKPEVKTPPLGVLSFLKGPLQDFSNFTTERNRKLFDRVIGAGKYQLTGDLAKYGKLDYGDLSEMTDEELEQAYQSLMSDRLSGKTDAFGNPLNQGDDDNNQILFPEDMENNTGDDSDDEDDTNTGGTAFRFMSRGGSPMDAPTTGGIMDLETGRQMYFLGKLVKKATRAVKKVAKSPIGKAALLYFGGQALMPGGGKGLSSFFGKGSFNPLKAMITTSGADGASQGLGLSKLGQIFNRFGLASGEGALTTKGMFGIGGGLLALLPFLSEEEQQQVIDSRGKGLDIPYIRNNPYTFRSRVGDGTGLMNRAYANGGRIGFDNGGYTLEQFMQDKSNVDKFMNQEQIKRLYEKMMKQKEVREQKQMVADGGRIGLKEGVTQDGLLFPMKKDGFLISPDFDNMTEEQKMMAETMKIQEKKRQERLRKLLEKFKESLPENERNIKPAPMPTIGPEFRKGLQSLAGGGRIGLKDGNGVADEEAENAKFVKRVRELMDEGFDMGEAVKEAMKEGYAEGGRIGLKGGTGSKILNFLKPFSGDTKGSKQLEGLLYGSEGIGEILRLLSSSGMFAEGGDVEPVAKKTMPLLDMDGKEMDLRAEGGFVPIGRMEKADDVPARLSKNEFVFTAEAVRNAGEGDVDKGAEVMYNMMKNLESGGEVSEESQGLEGARDMFQTSKRLEEVL
jgi:hypothetical protein